MKKTWFLLTFCASFAMILSACTAETVESNDTSAQLAVSRSFTVTSVADDPLMVNPLLPLGGQMIPNTMACNSQGPFWQAMATPAVNCKYVWIGPGTNQGSVSLSFGDIFFNNAHGCSSQQVNPPNPVVGVTNVRYTWTLSTGSGGLQIRPLVRTSTNQGALAGTGLFTNIVPNFNGTFSYDLNSNPDTMQAWKKTDLGCGSGHNGVQGPPEFGFQVINGSAPSGISGFTIRIDYQTDH